MTCAICGEATTPAQCGPTAFPDPCLGMLPGVIWACCGHGDTRSAYVVIAPGVEPMTPMPLLAPGQYVELRGEAALDYFDAGR